MPTRKLNTVTEREGVKYVRDVVEASNSIFKEQDLRNDYGDVPNSVELRRAALPG